MVTAGQMYVLLRMGWLAMVVLTPAPALSMLVMTSWRSALVRLDNGWATDQ